MASAPPVPRELRTAAQLFFGDRLPQVVRYAGLLLTVGMERGLIGPSEAPRLWPRHLLNCAAVEELVPANARVVDVGSGAGLPGVVLALARPDLQVVLLEPLARRADFLAYVVDELSLERASVVRARAEECGPGGPVEPADIVTARAVAQLDRLVGWSLPLVAPGGRLLAIKGATIAEELARHGAAIAQLSGSEPRIHQCGLGVIDPPTTVVEIVRERVRPNETSRFQPRHPSGRRGRTPRA